MRFASACDASKNTASFKSVNACKGVLERLRRTQAVSEVGASKVMSEGYGFVHRVSDDVTADPWNDESDLTRREAMILHAAITAK